MSRKINSEWMLSLFFGIFMIVVSIIILPFRQVLAWDYIIALQFIVIGVVCVSGIIVESKRHSFSLLLMHWIYIFMFIFCGGIAQCGEQHFLWRFSFENTSVQLTNCYIIVWVGLVFLSSVRCGKNVVLSKRSSIKLLDVNKNYGGEVDCVLVLTVVLLLCGISVVVKDGFYSLLSRSTYNGLRIANFDGNTSLGIALSSIISGLAMWGMIGTISICRRKNSVSNKILLILSVIACLIIVPPLGVARYKFATVYLGFVLFKSNRFKRGKLFVICFFAGLLFLFPFLNSRDLLQAIEGVDKQFSAADYDSYTMLVATVKYISKEGITYGKQLLTAVFFFVPRSIWATKSIGSGDTIMLAIGPENPDLNVSCPLIGEALINFGLFGVCFFALLVGCLCKKIDDKYWDSIDNWKTYGGALYTSTIPFFFFLLRGDMLSTFSFFIGFVCSLVIYRRFFGK